MPVKRCGELDSAAATGDLTPSKADIVATKELKDVATRLKVSLLDHLIVNASSPAYRSLAEEGVV